MKSLVSNALSKNGVQYQISLLLLPILPGSVALLVWYVFFYETSPQDAPMAIIVLTLVGSIILLQQELDVIRFLRVASLTAKKVTLTDDAVTLTLFSNRLVRLRHFTLSNDADRYTKSSVHKRLFPKGTQNISVFTDGHEYFISSTTENFETLTRILYQRGQAGGGSR